MTVITILIWPSSNKEKTMNILLIFWKTYWTVHYTYLSWRVTWSFVQQGNGSVYTGRQLSSIALTENSSLLPWQMSWLICNHRELCPFDLVVLTILSFWQITDSVFSDGGLGHFALTENWYVSFLNVLYSKVLIGFSLILDWDDFLLQSSMS